MFDQQQIIIVSGNTLNMPFSILVINKMSVFVLLITLTPEVSIKCYGPS